MPSLGDLLSRGYFPKDLPPPFSTASYSRIVESASASSRLPAQFDSLTTKSETISHNLFRGKTLRRTLGIPNPVHFYRLTKFVVDNWSFLSAKASRSSLSLTKPVDSAHGRAFVTANLSTKPLHRARIRATCRYVVHADIARFYPTLYTHSISCALHTKAAAKARRGTALGDALDKIVRNGQDRQTLGIPIGPDTSLLISEIVLGAVDEEFCDGSSVTGFRYIDDYELAYQTRADAESACTRLQEVLTGYELALNPAKTNIFELPLPLQPLAFSELRVLRLRRNRSAQRSDLLRFFDRAFALSVAEPDEHILNYAIGRLARSTVDTTNWDCLQSLLIQAALTAPSCLRFALRELWRYAALGYPLNTAQISAGLNAIIAGHAPLGHGDEVAWAIWGLISISGSLDDASAAAAARMVDSIVALVLLHARERGLVPRSVVFGPHLAFMKREELYGSQWLLAYEANMKGWLPSAGGVPDHVALDECFGFLKREGVSFYDTTTPPIPPVAVSGLGFELPAGSSDAAEIEGETYE